MTNRRWVMAIPIFGFSSFSLSNVIKWLIGCFFFFFHPKCVVKLIWANCDYKIFGDEYIFIIIINWKGDIPTFDSSTFSAAEILKMAMGDPCNSNYPMLISLFIIKDHTSRDCLFEHVYGSTAWFKIVDNVTRNIFASGIIGHNSHSSSISKPLLKKRLYLTNILNVITPKHIVRCKYHKGMANGN